MRHNPRLGILLVVLSTLFIFETSPALAQPAGGDPRHRFSQLPLHFEANEGQVDPRAKFVGRGDGYDVFLTPTETVLALAGAKPGTAGPVVRMKLVGARTAAAVTGRDKQPGVVNYFVGRDPARWRKDVPTYARVHYDDVYPGIDAIFYGQRRQLEYDLVVAPGADPDLITLQFDGADAIRVETGGDLVLRTGATDIRLRKPVIYQNVKGARKQVAGGYALAQDTRQVTFTVGDYDRSLPLVIDPVLAIVYSSLLGGSDPSGFFSMTSGQAIAVDASGSAYVVGMTTAIDFPTVNALQSTLLGRSDAFIVKFHPSGSSLVYATYFGGSVGDGSGEFGGAPTTIANGVAVDAGGNAYVTGGTTATDLPTINAYQPSSGGDSEAFVIKLNETGSTLLYSSYLGGSGADGAEGIMLGPDGTAFLTGSTRSTNFPTRNAFQPDLAGDGDAFAARIDTSIAGNGSLVYSTYLGGPQDDAGLAIAVDATGNAHVVGIASAGFPVLNGLTLSGTGLFEAFLSKVSLDGTTLLYSTLLGGSDTEQANSVAIDAAGNTYVTGWTTSVDFHSKNALQPTIDGFQDAFLAKVNTLATGEASLVYSTYFGGDGGDEGTALAIDGDGMVILAGVTSSPDFTLLSPLFFAAGSAYVARFGPTGALDFSTRLGENDQARPLGIAVDAARDIYVTGELFLVGADPLFPATPTAFQGPVPPDSGAAFVTKIGTGTQFGLDAVAPNHGGNTGYASAMLRGEGFDSTTTVKLVRPGQADIIGRVVVVNTGLLSVTFDLHDAPLGVYDVVVTNAGGRTVTIAGGFTVEGGVPPKMWVDIVGPDTVRNNRETPFTIFYGNRGNTDALGVMLKLTGIPTGAGVRLGFETQPTFLAPENEPFRLASHSPVIETPDGPVVMLFLGTVPPNVVGTLTIYIQPNEPLDPPAQPFQLRVTASVPFFGSPMRGPSQACIDHIASTLGGEIADALGLTPPGLGCIQAIGSLVGTSLGNFVENAQDAYNGTLSGQSLVTQAGEVFADNIKAQLACAADFATIALPEAKLLQLILQVLSKIPIYFETLDACEPEDDDAEDESEVITVGSFDPNEKIGASGIGPERFITGLEPLRYTVQFENLATATAPAQEVVITDQLDTTKLDLSTFSLGPIGFGSSSEVQPMPGLKTYETDIDLRPAKDLIVRVRAHLDTATGLLTYRLTSLDPATALPPSDALAGFLPPNVNHPEGSGRVLFTVMPRSGLPTGTAVRNAARIVFDTNAPIDTPEWVNTIDTSTPSSAVAPLPATSTNPAVLVQWAGTDAHAGVRDYTVYVSQNGGPFTLFAQNTTDTSRALNGVVGSTYAFYSIARDRAGNVEGAKTLAEATVTIVPVVTPPPSLDGRMSGSGFVEPPSGKWHFVFKAGDGSVWLEIWANGPGKRFVATSLVARTASDAVTLSGGGTWNGVAGYTVEATAADRGEPGKNSDLFSFVIKDPAGNVVATATGKLGGGNIQSKR